MTFVSRDYYSSLRTPHTDLMKLRHLPYSACLAALSCVPLLVASTKAEAQQPAISPRAVFLHPPAEARPMVRWWWFGPAVTHPEILRELEQMKADGIGGAELAFVYPESLDDPPRGIHNTAFLSPEHLNAIRYAQVEGRRLGLRIDITLCSGWPYGGPKTTLAEAAGRLRLLELPLAADATTVPAPKLEEGEKVIATFLAPGEPKRWSASDALRMPSKLMPAKTSRVVLFFLSSHTHQKVKRASVGAEGYVLDPFSKQAVASHLKNVGTPLLSAFGSTPPYAIFSDSLEAYGADWTPTLPEEFRKRRGYDLLAHLPELYAGGTAAAECVRHDWGRTLTELVDENYLTQINDWARAHGTRFRSQTYGEPAVSLASQRLVALPEGEGPQWRAFSTLRWASSANHLFGNTVTSGETYTWLHSPVFRATPLDMKAEADIDFLMGENQLIFHGWPYSAPGAGEPGWSLYAAGAFNDHNPWHPVMPAVTEYITRLSALLRLGKPANQVALLLPTDDAWASFKPGKVTVTGAMQHLIPAELQSAILAAGYNDDFVDADTIDRLGVRYPLLLIPPTERIPITTLKQIASFVAGGGHALTIGHQPALNAEGEALSAQEQSILTGFPHVANIADVPAALHALLTPDLVLHSDDAKTAETLGFIRRELPGADIYYVVNTGNTPVDTSITLASRHPYAEQWNPDTTVAAAVPREQQELHLAPYASTLFVFTEAKSAHNNAFSSAHVLADLTHDWNIRFVGAKITRENADLSDWAASPATEHFSGEAVYSHTLQLADVPRGRILFAIDGGRPLLDASTNSKREAPALGANGLPNPLITRTGPGMSAHFDPPVREAALLIVNGKPAGALWHPPYQLDIAPLLQTGTNTIELHVFNTALNAWSALPPHDYKPLTERYGNRFQMQDLDKVQPLPSGIFGTITLVNEAP
ncbi:MAG: glycosyl hydrolase [Acidobacteriaceae bacterium]|nr:glycosyl hydrolase [Acidobacteriaceae bacterium]